MYLSVEAGLLNTISGEMEVGFLIHVVSGQVKHREGSLGLVLGLMSSQCLRSTTACLRPLDCATPKL